MESLIIKFNDDSEFRKKYNNVGTYEQQQQNDFLVPFPQMRKRKMKMKIL